MKALSVRQPWATYLATGEKTIECRTWTTPYRGELLICASGSKWRWFEKGDPDDDGFFLPAGLALAVVKLTDIRRMTRKDAKDALMDESWVDARQYAWRVELVTPVVPFPVKGKLHIYDVEHEIRPLPDRFPNIIEYFRWQQHLPWLQADGTESRDYS